MSEMIEFSTAMLSLVCDFLSAPPISYLFGLFCFCAVCKAVKILLSQN